MESWVVKNNTRGPLALPGNKIKFNLPNQEKDLVFFTGKSVAQLEKDTEILQNIQEKNIITVEIVRDCHGLDEDSIKKFAKELQQDKNISREISELKNLIRDTSQQVRNQPVAPIAAEPINMQELANIIRENVQINISQGEGQTSYNTEDEKMREDALESLIFSKKTKDTKNFKELGNKKKVENEASGNEDLLDF